MSYGLIINVLGITLIVLGAIVLVNFFSEANLFEFKIRTVDLQKLWRNGGENNTCKQTILKVVATSLKPSVQDGNN